MSNRSLHRTFPVRVPTVKINRAKELKLNLAKDGVFVSLYDCLLMIERRDNGPRDVDPFRRVRL